RFLSIPKMSSSRSEGKLIESHDQVNILIDGEKGVDFNEENAIGQYVISLNGQYVAIWNYENQTISGWNITKELTSEFDKSINITELEILDTDI
ncbi:20925_t:CDS:1, partial [Cetraspora pellucida]